MAAGTVDAAVGNLQFVGGQARKKTLFTESYSCLLSASHPTLHDTLMLDNYVAADHVVVAPFTGHHLVKDVMTEMGLHRKVKLRVPHFTSLVEAIASTDLLLTLPTRMAHAFAGNGRMRVLPLSLPLPIPIFEVNLYWRPNAQDSSAQQWFCDTIARTLSRL